MTAVILMDSFSVTRKYSIQLQVRGLTDKNNLFYHPGEDDKDCDSESPSRLSGFDPVDKDRERGHRDDVTAALLHPGSGVGGGGRTRTNSDLHGSFPELIKHRDVLMERDASVTPVDSNLLLPNISNNNNNSNLINNNTTNTNNNKRRRKNSLNCDNTTSSSITTAHGAQERHYSQDSQVRMICWWTWTRAWLLLTGLLLFVAGVVPQQPKVESFAEAESAGQQHGGGYAPQFTVDKSVEDQARIT